MNLLSDSSAVEPVTLSAVEFDVLWQHFDLGEMPLVLSVPSPGKTRAERAALENQVWLDLEQRGLGQASPALFGVVDLLRLLARPEHEVDGRLWLGRSVRVLAAGVGDAGALAVLDNMQLTVRQISGFGLPRETVGILRPISAGPGHSVTIPSPDLDAAAQAAESSPEAFVPALLQRGVREADANTLSSMITGFTDRGQFGVASRHNRERRERASRVIAFFDTPNGRYVQTRYVESDGSAWSTIAPADNRRLIQHLTTLTTDLN